MPRKTTIDTVIAKLVNKDIFYMSPEALRDKVRFSIAYTLASDLPKDDLYTANLLGFYADAGELIYGNLPLETLQPTEAQRREIEEQLAQLGTKQLLPSLGALTPERLEALNFNTQYINYLWTWAGLPATNGKPNFYSIYSQNKKNYFDDSSWINIFKQPLRNDTTGSRLTKKEFFELLKDITLKHLEINIDLYSELEEGGPLRKIHQQLTALTWKEISDRHKVEAKPPVVYQKLDNIARIAHVESFDFIGALLKVSENRDFITGGRVIQFENKVIKATAALPTEYEGDLSFSSVFTDKFLTECRIRLLEQRNINDTDTDTNKAIISIPIPDAMLALGYAQTTEQAEDAQLQRDFMKEVRATCNFLYSIDVEEKRKDGQRYRVLSSFRKGGRVEAAFTSRFLEAQKQSHAFEYVLRSIARKIPNKKVAEYYLAKKLVNNATNTTNIGKNQGREGRISIKALYEDLEAKNALYPTDSTRNASRKKLNRFLAAINYLRDNKIVNLVLEDKNGDTFEPKSNEYYTANIEAINELMACYIVPDLKHFIESSRQEFMLKEVTRKQKAIEGAERKRKKQAKAKKQDAEEVIEAEVVEEEKSPWEY